MEKLLSGVRKHMKFLKTFNLYACFFIIGLVTSLTGPCLLDLQRLVHTDAQHIAIIFSVRSIGYLLGAIIGGILLDASRYKLAILTVSNFVVAITTFGVPWSWNLEILMAVMSINTFSMGAIVTGSNVMCLELWGKDSNPVFQGLHLAFSFGGFVSPLIAASFLENVREQSINGDNMIDNTTFLSEDFFNTTDSDAFFSDNITFSTEGRPRIFYPFSITAAFTLFITIIQIGICLLSPTEDRSQKDTSKSDNSDRSFLSMFFTVIFTFALFFVISGIEVGYAQTLTVFSVKSKLHLTTKQGSYMTSALWGTHSVGRLLSVFLTLKFSCLKLIIADICLVIFAALVLLFLMPNEWALWLASMSLGTGIAPAYGSVVGWINTHINISSKFSATFAVGGATGEIVVPSVIIYFMITDPDMFCYVTAALTGLLTILTFIMHCILKYGSKRKKPQNVNCSIIDGIEAKA